MDRAILSPNQLQRELGKAMRALRISRNLTQKEVALKGRVTLRALANLERGGGSTVETWLRALHALGATDFIAKLAPEIQVSPLALLRSENGVRQRVRHARPGP